MYNKTNWVDHIIDPSTGEILQQGTPINARNLNNIEEGIEGNFNTLEDMYIKNEVDNKLALKANLSTQSTHTLLSNMWESAEASFTYTLYVEGVTSNSIQDVLLETNATKEQIEVFNALGLVDGGQSENSITLKTWSEKPPIDLPILIIVRGG